MYVAPEDFNRFVASVLATFGAIPARKTKRYVSFNRLSRKEKPTIPATISCPPSAHGQSVFSAPDLLRVIDRADRQKN